jgi:hypothetical protein
MRLPTPSPSIEIAAIGSLTGAIKAQRALARMGISAEIVSLSPGETRHGCAYGISFAAAGSAAVRRSLRAAGIAVSEYLQKSGGE